MMLKIQNLQISVEKKVLAHLYKKTNLFEPIKQLLIFWKQSIIVNKWLVPLAIF